MFVVVEMRLRRGRNIAILTCLSLAQVGGRRRGRTSCRLCIYIAAGRTAPSFDSVDTSENSSVDELPLLADGSRTTDYRQPGHPYLLSRAAWRVCAMVTGGDG